VEPLLIFPHNKLLIAVYKAELKNAHKMQDVKVVTQSLLLNGQKNINLSQKQIIHIKHGISPIKNAKTFLE